MADDSAEPRDVSVSLADGLAAVSRSEWDALANPPDRAYDPFVSWDFLEALERSGCAAPATGWTPQHILARNPGGGLVGAAPLYVKTHSRGEFVFDHSWADALHRAGGNYYPKLLCAVPFTPVTGARLLTATDSDDQMRGVLVQAIVEYAKAWRLSSAHFNFLSAADADAAEAAQLILRFDQQFHWINEGYGSFSDFLAALSSRKRKMIRKEREAARQGLEIVRLSGDQIREAHWDAFFDFYMDTGGRKWGSPYLTRDFFSLLHERMADRCLLVLAFDGARPIAGALNMLGSEAVFGRYWGRAENRPFLHFEICYYQAIDHAIETGLARVEAGAQGEHKLARGYSPALTVSAHWIAHPGFRQAVASYLERERPAVLESMSELTSYTPFRRTLDGGEQAVDEEESF